VTRQEKIARKAADARIDRAYKLTCSNIQIDVFDISKVFHVGHLAIAEGVDDAELSVRIRAFVETVRKD